MARSKRKKVILAVVAALLGALILAAMALALIINWRLDSRLAAIRAAGDPVTPAELDAYYPEPPPGQNAAPLFAAAFQQVKDPSKDPRYKRLPILGLAELPEVGEPMPADMLEATRSYLKDNAEVLKVLRQAVALDECKFPVDFSEGMTLELEHVALLRQAARLFVLEAVERVESRRPAEAAESLRAALRCGFALRKEPTLTSGLVRIGCERVALIYLERWASRDEVPLAATRRLERALRAAAEADPENVERIWVGERCLAICTFQNIVIRPARFPMRYLFKADLTFYLDAMGELVAAARKPYPASLIAGARLSSTTKAPRYATLGGMLLPVYAGVFARSQRHRVRLDSARMALAALRYRAKHGKLPDSLDALVPDFVEAVPVDPFNGQPLRYRRSDDGFVVYAVGHNGKDDGGDLEFDPDAGRSPDQGFRVRWPKAAARERHPHPSPLPKGEGGRRQHG